MKSELNDLNELKKKDRMLSVMKVGRISQLGV